MVRPASPVVCVSECIICVFGSVSLITRPFLVSDKMKRRRKGGRRRAKEYTHKRWRRIGNHCGGIKSNEKTVFHSSFFFYELRGAQLFARVAPLFVCVSVEAGDMTPPHTQSRRRKKQKVVSSLIILLFPFVVLSMQKTLKRKNGMLSFPLCFTSKKKKKHRLFVVNRGERGMHRKARITSALVYMPFLKNEAQVLFCCFRSVCCTDMYE